MQYKCTLLLEPKDIIVGVSLKIEKEKCAGRLVNEALEMVDGNVKKAANLLNCDRHTVYNYCKKWGIDIEKIRQTGESNVHIVLSRIYRG